MIVKTHKLNIRKRKRPRRQPLVNARQVPFKAAPIRARFRFRREVWTKTSMDRHDGFAMNKSGELKRLNEYENVELFLDSIPQET